MTKEIIDIIKAYGKAVQQGKHTALATVVHVEGSSYRRPGARMLVTDDGQLTGAISGGCLEGDALRKALFAIHQQQAKLVTYDTTDEDDLKFGVQLGCNGIVHILFEPIKNNEAANPIALLQQLLGKREPAVLATLFSLRGSQQAGTSLLYRTDEIQTTLQGDLKEAVLKDAEDAMTKCSSSLRDYGQATMTLQGFVEYIPPPVSVVIAGAGNDAQPLVEMASILGWQTTVVDGRPLKATGTRFPKANKVAVAKPGEVLEHVQPDAQTVFLLMTHNYNYDLALLKALLQVECGYIGVLGPKKKMQRMWADLEEENFIVTEAQRAKIYAPLGLDIGAETAEEIAVAVVAEIKAALSNREGGPLKNKSSAIHQRSQKHGALHG